MTGQERDALLARWLLLTRHTLPAMAAGQGWPVSLDHCFMRICLDAAVGAPWHTVISRPAVRHATVDQLRRAVQVAEGVVASPGLLPGLNNRSLAARRRLRASSAPP